MKSRSAIALLSLIFWVLTGWLPSAIALTKSEIAVSAAFDSKGRLWRVYARDGRILVDHSKDLGKSYSQPIQLNDASENAQGTPGNRPHIVIDTEDRITIIYYNRITPGYTDKSRYSYQLTDYAGQIRYSRSTDGGERFSPPQNVHNDGEAVNHAYASMAVSPSGAVFVAWLDKRDLLRIESEGRSQVGPDIYFATFNSEENQTFESKNFHAVKSVCECCRTAMAMDVDSNAVLLSRMLFDEAKVRDHAVVKLASDGSHGVVTRIPEDDWKVDACPHHGPAIDIATDGRYHLAWFTQGAVRKGVFYAFSNDQGKTYSEPLRLPGRAANPQVTSTGERVVVAWRVTEGPRTQVLAMESQDRGETWSPPKAFLSAESLSDYPILVRNNNDIYLSWNRAKEGYSLLRLESFL